MEETIKISRKMLFTILALVIIAIALASYFFVYVPSEEKKAETNVYKKALYESILCQYSCPLEEAEVLNQTQTIPSLECVNTCITNLRESGLTGEQFSSDELLEDDLVRDVETAISNCRAESVNEDGTTDNERFFACGKEALESLKEKYPYL